MFMKLRLISSEFNNRYNRLKVKIVFGITQSDFLQRIIQACYFEFYCRTILALYRI